MSFSRWSSVEVAYAHGGSAAMGRQNGICVYYWTQLARHGGGQPQQQLTMFPVVLQLAGLLYMVGVLPLSERACGGGGWHVCPLMAARAP